MVVAGSGQEEPYAAALASALDDLGVVSWLLSRDVPIGASMVGRIDSQLRRAKALILCMTHTVTPDEWAKRQLRAFQAITTANDTLLLLIISDDRSLGTMLLAKSHAIVLPPQVEAARAARMCVLAARFGSQIAQGNSLDALHTSAIPSGAWSLVPDLDSTYDIYVGSIENLVRLGEYDVANELYWRTLRYSGYRERWRERLAISQALLELSLSRGDHLVAALILAKGIAYTYVETRQFSHALRALRSAYQHSEIAADQRGRGICWSYYGDMNAYGGRPNMAVRAYEEAAAFLRGLEKHEVMLKRQYVVCTALHRSPLQQLATLQRLHAEFNEIDNYRVGLIDIAMARLLISVGAISEAHMRAKSAHDFFVNTVKMPRNAKPAAELMRSIVASEMRANDSALVAPDDKESMPRGGKHAA